ncbi:MAG: HAD family hydrolase [Candidatus Scalinduaceae bacterium]
MSYKAVLFDLDGTLLDTLEDLGSVMNRVLTRKGYPTHKLDNYRYLVGDGATTLIKRALPEEKRNDNIIRSCLEAFLKDYDQNWNVKTKPYNGITEMLDTLTACGMKMAVLSNKPHEFTNRCVTHFLPSWNFDMVLGQCDEFPSKPDPAGALKVAECLNLSPSDFLYLGDTAVDMKTSIAAGMFPVGVLWGFRSAKELRENGAQVLIKKPLEILNLLD